MFIKRFFVVINFFLGILLLIFSYCKSPVDISLRQNDILYQISFDGIKALKKQEEEILFLLNIPRINLRKEVYTKNSSLNDVDFGIQLLKESNLDNYFLFLAAHSGNSKISYFNRLIELEQGDIIWLEEGKEVVLFVVEEKFYIEKKGYFEYSSEDIQGILYLITCSLENNEEQLVVKGRLVY